MRTYKAFRGWRGCRHLLRSPGRVLPALLLIVSWTGALAQSTVPDPMHRLWLRQGDPLVGKLLTPRLDLRTPYARMQLPTTVVSSADLAEGPTQLDTLRLTNGDRVSGFLLNPQLDFVPQTGPQLSLRHERVARLELQRLESTELRSTNTALVFLRNGDRLSGRWLGGPFRISTPQTDIRLAVGQIESITFADTHPTLVTLRTRSGDQVEGVWPDLDLIVGLEVGGDLQLHPNRILSIDCRIARQNGPLSTRTNRVDDGSAKPPVPGLVWIPPGVFLMGSPAEELDRDLDEGPQTRVTLTYGIWMGAHEVTQAEYREVMEANPSLFLGDPRRPVERVRHRDAAEYCTRLTQGHLVRGDLPEHHVFRLPTEAEWEYACRAGASTRYSYGDDSQGHNLENHAWFNRNSDSSPQPVGSRTPNAWGLHDMHGNVLEWCQDGATSALPGGSVTNYQAASRGLLRIAKGGSWLQYAKSCRSANRDSYGENTRSSDLGFRIVLAPKLPIEEPR